VKSGGERARKEPPTSRGGDKRERILVAAAKTFVDHGYTGTTLAMIADAVETHAGSLYYYFESREDLITEVLIRGITDITANTQRTVSELHPSATAADRLATAIKAHVTYTVTESDFTRAGGRAVGQVPAEIQRLLMPHYEAYGRFMAELFEAAKTDGAIAADVDAGVLRMLVFGASNWTMEWYDPKGPCTPDDIGDLLTRMVFHGVGGR